MSRTVLQIPLSIDLRREAEKEAEKQGFSSLQDAIRLFLKKLADKAIRISFEETIQLSQKAIKRYERIDEDIEKKRNVYSAKDTFNKGSCSSEKIPNIPY